MQKWSRHTCVRDHMLLIYCIWLQRHFIANTSTIFVRIWSSRCIIYHLNGHTCQYVLHFVILVAIKRGCLRTDVIQLWHNQNSNKRRNNNRNKNNTQNPRLFQAFKFFFFAYISYTLLFVYLTRARLLLCLTYSLNFFFFLSYISCALVRPDRMFVYADLKSIF